MPVIGIVANTCLPEMEEKFSKWYSERHIPDVMKFKGVKKATRYKMAGAAIGNPEVGVLTVTGAKEGYPKFLAIYEFENPQGFERFNASPEIALIRKDWHMVEEEIGAELFWGVQYESIKAWEQ